MHPSHIQTHTLCILSNFFPLSSFLPSFFSLALVVFRCATITLCVCCLFFLFIYMHRVFHAHSIHSTLFHHFEQLGFCITIEIRTLFFFIIFGILSPLSFLLRSHSSLSLSLSFPQFDAAHKTFFYHGAKNKLRSFGFYSHRLLFASSFFCVDMCAIHTIFLSLVHFFSSSLVSPILAGYGVCMRFVYFML